MSQPSAHGGWGSEAANLLDSAAQSLEVTTTPLHSDKDSRTDQDFNILNDQVAWYTQQHPEIRKITWSTDHVFDDCTQYEGRTIPYTMALCHTFTNNPQY